ncbi:hypothetical protein LE190_11360 [Massilia oculi]|uniref:Lipoprotein n=1 Tax=Massilia hydrophila TaxID=3044279 RepID=A0ABS7YBM9_9BURK|nr:hypothetical protein [Massilia oculi]MCA1856512.1 hypothetical protein [Massilia oculi]
MQNKRRVLVLALALAMGAAMSQLTACDGARESLATAIKPASAADVASAMRAQITQGKFAEAGAQGVAFLNDKQDAAGVVAWETAKASAQAGKADDAVRFAELAIKGGAISGVDLMAEPLLEPVRTDLRLVALAAGGAEGAAVARTQASVPADAEATIDASGVKARAGDVSVELPQ